MKNGLDKNKVILGLSGGVDSTAAALLLQDRGYEVIGMYFDIWPECDSDNQDHAKGSASGSLGDPGVSGASGKARAQLAAEQLGIKFVYRNVNQAFEDSVVCNFCSEYAAGRTPNPCIVCNPLVKFKTMLDVADEMGAYYIATGHYADTYHDEENDLWYIRKAANEKKDQSYMLYRLGQEAISRLILPLNDMDDKEQVRQLAREKALTNAEAKDSQEICFIDVSDNYKAFLGRRGITASEGDFVDSEGNVLGRHKGILNYTIGQRKGLGIALGKPAFVTKIDGDSNQVVLGDNADLFHTEVVSGGNVLVGDIPDGKVTAKIRYAARPAEAELEMLDDGRIRATFTEPQRAATPGQSIVFYKADLVIGGGFIE